MTTAARLRIGRWLLGAGLLGLAGCVEPYSPKVEQAERDLLVVDGFINTRGATSVKLTRTVSLGSKGLPPTERQARVFVEDERGRQYALTEGAGGIYTSASTNLDLTTKYRLHLFTKAGKEYLSDFTEAKVTPEVDSLTWRIVPRGLDIRISTHDASGKSVYYRWNYDETWEYASARPSYIDYRRNRIVRRDPQIYQCWVISPGSTIVLGNTARLSRDVLTNVPLLQHPRDAWRLRVRYSVRVLQQAQTPEEYSYWEQLRKNTESIGSIYDALPTQLTGNVHCATNADEQVLGYVGAYSVTEKRIFIDRTQYPQGWLTAQDPYASCGGYVAIMPRDYAYAFNTGQYIPIDVIEDPRGDTVGITAGSPECIDCRRRGTNVRPAYW